MVVVTVIAVVLFDVPFVGPVWQLTLGGVLFLITTMGMGVLISTMSQSQGQAIQLAMMATLPQVLLSGMIFPLSSMAAGIRWIAYVLPLTYFVPIARDTMTKGTSFTAIWEPYALLTVLGVAVLSLALVRFRRDLGPSARTRRKLAERAAEPGSGA
jgi:ABC-2 type transport system permease protein